MNFFSAAIPEPHTVLGLRLLPFSAGHLVLLNRIGNQFARLANLSEEEDGFIPDFDDLVSGIWLCHKPYKDGLEELKDLSAWSRKMGRWIAQYVKERGAINIPEKCRAFAKYLMDGTSTPKFFPRSSEMGVSMEVQVPKLELVKIALLRDHVVENEREFLNRPWGLSLWDYFVLRAMHGQGEIYDGAKVKSAIEVAKAAAEAIQRREQKADARRKARKLTQRRAAKKKVKRGGKRHG